MQNAPYAEPLVSTNSSNAAAVAGRARLQGVLNQLNPAGGILDPGDGSGRHAKNVKRGAKKGESKNSPAANGAPTRAETENGAQD
jgi:hypothetical protein